MMRTKTAIEVDKYRVLASTDGLPHADWLELRRLGLGGSDASVVCGINKYKSPVELFMEKTDMFPPKEAGEAAYWGNRLESLVREEFTMRTGIEVLLVKQVLQSVEYPWMTANLDGICQHPHYGTCIFEAKTASTYLSGEWEDDKIPDSYMLQCQHYMAVTGFKGCYIAVLIGGNTFKWRFIERDEELISMLIELEADFWEHVVTNTPPPLDGSEAAENFLKIRFPNSVPSSRIELPESANALIMQYDTASIEVDKYTEQKDEAANLLKQMLGEHEAGTIGDSIITWKTVTQERLDSKTLKVEHPTLYKKYANQVSYRRFSIKTAAE